MKCSDRGAAIPRLRALSAAGVATAVALGGGTAVLAFEGPASAAAVSIFARSAAANTVAGEDLTTLATDSTAELARKAKVFQNGVIGYTRLMEMNRSAQEQIDAILANPGAWEADTLQRLRISRTECEAAYQDAAKGFAAYSTALARVRAEQAARTGTSITTPVPPTTNPAPPKLTTVFSTLAAATPAAFKVTAPADPRVNTPIRVAVTPMVIKGATLTNGQLRFHLRSPGGKTILTQTRVSTLSKGGMSAAQFTATVKARGVHTLLVEGEYAGTKTITTIIRGTQTVKRLPDTKKVVRTVTLRVR